MFLLTNWYCGCAALTVTSSSGTGRSSRGGLSAFLTCHASTRLTVQSGVAMEF